MFQTFLGMRRWKIESSRMREEREKLFFLIFFSSLWFLWLGRKLLPKTVWYFNFQLSPLHKSNEFLIFFSHFLSAIFFLFLMLRLSCFIFVASSSESRIKIGKMKNENSPTRFNTLKIESRMKKNFSISTQNRWWNWKEREIPKLNQNHFWGYFESISRERERDFCVLVFIFLYWNWRLLVFLFRLWNLSSL